MQRYFVNDDSIKENLIYLEENDYHHIKNVMRMNIGDEIIVTAFSGLTYKALISTFTKREVVATIQQNIDIKDNTLNITLAQALIKRDNFELVLEKATELGVREIIPLMTTNSVVKLDDLSKKIPRYQTIVKEASEQSERAKMPQICQMHHIETLPYEDYDHILIAYARHDTRELKSIISSIDPKDKVLVVIGPEGGFTNSEIEFLSQKGKLVSLGDTILRSETAGIYIVSAFRLIWGG